MDVMFVSKHESLQMTSLHWQLTHTRLEGGQLLSEIVVLCFEGAYSKADDYGLDEVPKYPYRSIGRKVLLKDNVTSLKLN